MKQEERNKTYLFCKNIITNSDYKDIDVLHNTYFGVEFKQDGFEYRIDFNNFFPIIFGRKLIVSKLDYSTIDGLDFEITNKLKLSKSEYNELKEIVLNKLPKKKLLKIN